MTHIELLDRSDAANAPNRPAAAGCQHQVGKLGTWIQSGAPTKPLLVLATFVCRHCDAAIDVRHIDGPGLPRMQFERSYPYSTSFRGRRVRS